jgi:hypothetical protein
MKKILRNICLPILRIFESGEVEYRYKKSHRTILIVVGVLFLVLSTVSAVSAITASQMGGLIPVIVFFVVGFVCQVIGLLGNDHAVAKIWGSK